MKAGIECWWVLDLCLRACLCPSTGMIETQIEWRFVLIVSHFGTEAGVATLDGYDVVLEGWEEWGCECQSYSVCYLRLRLASCVGVLG